MKGFKMLLTLALVLTLLCSFAVPALAYVDGDREVLYYNFEISNGARCGVSSNTMMRRFNRQWVVTISSRSGNSYPITYGMLDMINSESHLDHRYSAIDNLLAGCDDVIPRRKLELEISAAIITVPTLLVQICGWAP